jgi:hypothetical protein
MSTSFSSSASIVLFLVIAGKLETNHLLTLLYMSFTIELQKAMRIGLCEMCLKVSQILIDLLIVSANEINLNSENGQNKSLYCAQTGKLKNVSGVFIWLNSDEPITKVEKNGCAETIRSNGL